MPSPQLQIEIQYASVAIETALNAIAPPSLMKKWVKEAIPHAGLITLRFVNSAEGKQLNSAFRQQDKPTNVLTFAYELSKKTVVADIVLCLPVIRREAREQSKVVKAHLAHLIIHGCLHAQGLDHEILKEAKKMEKQEVSVLKLLGFNNPYQDITRF